MKTSGKNFLNMESDEYVEPGHDVATEGDRGEDRQILQQLAELADAIDRLQKRVEELERREPW